MTDTDRWAEWDVDKYCTVFSHLPVYAADRVGVSRR